MRNYHIYKAAEAAPVVFLLTGDEDGAATWEAARALSARAFSLAVVPVEDWNRALSPWAAQGIETTFELNPGNHFQDAELRLAKGIEWMMLRGAQAQR